MPIGGPPGYIYNVIKHRLLGIGAGIARVRVTLCGFLGFSDLAVILNLRGLGLSDVVLILSLRGLGFSNLIVILKLRGLGLNDIIVILNLRGLLGLGRRLVLDGQQSSFCLAALLGSCQPCPEPSPGLAGSTRPVSQWRESGFSGCS